MLKAYALQARIKQLQDYDSALGILNRSKPQYLYDSLGPVFSEENDILSILKTNHLKNKDEVRRYTKDEIIQLCMISDDQNKNDALSKKLVDTIYEQGGWFFDDYQNPSFIKGQISRTKIGMMKQEFLDASGLANTLRSRGSFNKKMDVRLGIADDKMPEYLIADISVFFVKGYPIHDGLKSIGVNCLNDLRKYELSDIKNITIDGKSKSEKLFTVQQAKKLEDDIPRYGGFFYNQQWKTEEACALIEQGKAIYKKKLQEADLRQNTSLPHLQVKSVLQPK